MGASSLQPAATNVIHRGSDILIQCCVLIVLTGPNDHGDYILTHLMVQSSYLYALNHVLDNQWTPSTVSEYAQVLPAANSGPVRRGANKGAISLDARLPISLSDTILSHNTNSFPAKANDLSNPLQPFGTSCNQYHMMVAAYITVHYFQF